MCEIVPFRNVGRPRAAAAPPEGSAQILFFLGVRYVRDDGGDGPKGRASEGGAPRKGRRRKRA